MGTRGTYGFIKNGEKKLSYNHFDSYPSGLGEKIKEYITTHSISQMNETFDKIRMVSDEKTYNVDFINNPLYEKYLKFSDNGVNGGCGWYALLRNVQGNLSAYDDPDLDVMLEGEGDEWEYVLNLDTNELEVSCLCHQITKRFSFEQISSIDFNTLEEEFSNEKEDL